MTPLTAYLLQGKGYKLGKLRDRAQAGYDADVQAVEDAYSANTGSYANNYEASKDAWFGRAAPAGLAPTDSYTSLNDFSNWVSARGSYPSAYTALNAGYIDGYNIDHDRGAYTYYQYGDPLPVPEEITKYNTAIDKLNSYAGFPQMYQSPGGDQQSPWLQYLMDYLKRAQ